MLWIIRLHNFGLSSPMTEINLGADSGERRGEMEIVTEEEEERERWR